MNKVDGLSRFRKAKRILREYYNEIIEIQEQEDDEEISREESERALQLLDHKYANRVLEEL